MESFQLYEQSKQAMRASFGHMERPDTHETRPTVEKVLQVKVEISPDIVLVVVANLPDQEKNSSKGTC